MSDERPGDPSRRIRQYRDADEADVVAVWHRAGIAAYTYLPTWQAFTVKLAHVVFRNVIRAGCAIWVGVLDEQIVAYLAMSGSYIDRLYVDPSEWRKGWGTRFIQLPSSSHRTGSNYIRIKKTMRRGRCMSGRASSP
jgi:hypothetical protein